jgi:hypothetical protein
MGLGIPEEPFTPDGLAHFAYEGRRPCSQVPLGLTIGLDSLLGYVLWDRWRSPISGIDRQNTVRVDDFTWRSNRQRSSRIDRRPTMVRVGACQAT